MQINIETNNLNKLVTSFYALFVISMPFNAVEWDLLGLNRFEIKITMITFMLLFITWVLVSLKNRIKLETNEIIIYSLMFLYVISQYLSLINSKDLIGSLQQSIVITVLSFMMIISAQLIIDRKIAHHVITTIAFTCVLFSIFLLVNYYLFSNEKRLGGLHWVSAFPSNSFFDKLVRGDPPYFGDIILYGLGPLYYTIFFFCRNKLRLILSIPIQIIIFSVIALTYTKGVLLSTLIFLIISFFLLKEKRIFIFLSCMLFFVTIITHVTVDRISFMPEQKAQIISEQTAQIIPPRDLSNYRKHGQSLFSDLTYDPDMITITKMKKIEPIMPPEEQISIVDKIVNEVSSSRLNIIGSLGRTSLDVRLKGIKVSLINSLPNIWLGNGAGTSQKLLPKMTRNYVKTKPIPPKLENYEMYVERIGVKNKFGTDYNFSGVIDSHNLLLTELFNVGVIGSLSLFSMICLILYKQLRVIIKKNNDKNNFLNELLLATLLSMLVHRMTDSFVAVPFLWLILGISLGVTKLKFNST